MKGKDSIISGIQYLNQFDIVIDERCFKTIEELDNYTWKKTKTQANTITNRWTRTTIVLTHYVIVLKC